MSWIETLAKPILDVLGVIIFTLIVVFIIIPLLFQLVGFDGLSLDGSVYNFFLSGPVKQVAGLAGYYLPMRDIIVCFIAIFVIKNLKFLFGVANYLVRMVSGR